MTRRKNTILRWFSLPVFRFISTALQSFRFIFLRQKIIRTFAFRTLFRIRFVILFFDDISARTPNNIDLSASYVIIVLGDFSPQANFYFLLLRYIYRAYQFIDNSYVLYSLPAYSFRFADG